MHLIIRFIVNAVALYCIAKYVPGFNHDVTVTAALIAAVIFGVVNAILGPILRLISLPITNQITVRPTMVITRALRVVLTFRKETTPARVVSMAP